MLSFKFLAAPSTFTSHPHKPSLPPSHLRALSKKLTVRALRYQLSSDNSSKDGEKSTLQDEKPAGGEDLRVEEKGIGGIQVPRQRYIAVPKAELLNALLSMFESKEDADEFLRLSMSLDAILHAEHKDMLEEMRSYYSLNHVRDPKGINGCSSVPSEEDLSSRHHLTTDVTGILDRTMNEQRNDEDDKPQYFDNILYLKNLFGSFSGLASTVPILEPRVAVATSFQRSFMQLLRNAEFEELSVQDLLLTYALNSDYLLTLPIYVDWKRASESKAIIFRRGYATERQSGLLLVEKLDYLQSKLLQGIFFSLSRPVKNVGIWLNEALESSREGQKIQIWIEKVKVWLKEQYSSERPWSGSTYNTKESEQITNSDLPIWLAAQRAIPRYEGVLSSIGPRGRLVRKLLTWIGIIPSVPVTSVNPENKTKYSERYLRPNFLPRITLSNIWEPATRELCGNNVWNMFKTGVSILFSQSTLQEPAFQELILLYTTETSQSESRDEAKSPPLQFKIYERIPIPDLPVVFPDKKLSFRILDTVSTRRSISDSCERFMYDKLNEKIEMPIDKAMNTLLRLELATEFPLDGSLEIKALPCTEACDTLRKRWDGMLGRKNNLF